MCMYIIIEHWINKANKIYIILETLRGDDPPSPLNWRQSDHSCVQFFTTFIDTGIICYISVSLPWHPNMPSHIRPRSFCSVFTCQTVSELFMLGRKRILGGFQHASNPPRQMKSSYRRPSMTWKRYRSLRGMDGNHNTYVASSNSRLETEQFQGLSDGGEVRQTSEEWIGGGEVLLLHRGYLLRPRKMRKFQLQDGIDHVTVSHRALPSYTSKQQEQPDLH